MNWPIAANLPNRLSSPRLDWLVAAAVALIALACVYLRGRDSNFDLLNYHYFSGYSLLRSRYLVDITPTMVLSFLNPMPNVPAYLAFSHLAFPASGWAIALLQLLVLPLLVLIARQLGRELDPRPGSRAEPLALALTLLAPLWWSELGTSFADATIAPLVLLGLYLGLRGIVQAASTSARQATLVVLLSGALFGIATGVKLTNAPFMMAFGVALFAASLRHRWRDTITLNLTFASGLAIGFSTTVWWNIHLLQRWESPIFPLYNAWLQSPWSDAVNYRDSRWFFGSPVAFVSYIWETVTGTVKTSEFVFADARILPFVALSLAAALALAIRPRRQVAGAASSALLVFLLVSSFLWSLTLAYQRYLISVELLLGLGIWVLLSRLVGAPRRVVFLLALCLVSSVALIKIPDWGHLPSKSARPGHFGISLPEAVASTPARYLILNQPIAYLLPSFHPDSRFYGLGFSAQVDALVGDRFFADDALPRRILTHQVDAASVWKILPRFRRVPETTYLSCAHFQTDIDGYFVCELRDRVAADEQASFSDVLIDFQDPTRALPPSVLGVGGLNAFETWGRWSDGDVVAVEFANCLPRGRLAINLRGHAFGPNIGQPVYFELGSSKASVVLGENDTDVSLTLDNNERCVTRISMRVPQKASPRDLGLSGDDRTLGVGMVRLGIRRVR